MQNVTYLAAYCKVQRITHYAYLGDVYGTAELLNGTGYLFRAEGGRKATVVAYHDVNLVLLGRVDLADSQHSADMAAGGYANVACSHAQEVR